MLSRAVVLGALLLGLTGPGRPDPSTTVPHAKVVDKSIEFAIPDPTDKQTYRVPDTPKYAGAKQGSLVITGSSARELRYTPVDDTADVDDEMRLQASVPNGAPPHTVVIKIKIYRKPISEEKTIELGAANAGPFTFINADPPKCGTAPVKGGDTATFTPKPNHQCAGDYVFSFISKAASPQKPEPITQITIVKLQVATPAQGGDGASGVVKPATDSKGIDLKAAAAPITFSEPRQSEDCGDLEFTRESGVYTYKPWGACSKENVLSFTARAQPDSNKAVTLTLKLLPQQGLQLFGKSIPEWALPAASVLFGLVALGMGLLLWKHASTVRDTAAREQEAVKGRMSELEGRLAALQGGRTAWQTPASQGTRGSRAAEDIAFSGEAGMADFIKPVKQIPTSGYGTPQQPATPARPDPAYDRPETLRPPGPSQAPLPPPMAPFGDGPAYPQAPDAYTSPSTLPPAPVPQEPARTQKTGDVAGDFTRAQSMGASGQDWFLASYSFVVLSCKNLGDRRRDPNAPLYFAEEPRGHFMGVQHEGRTFLLPALNKDPEAASASLEGAFHYPHGQDGALRVLQPGTLRAVGAEWVLEQDGVIGRG